MNSTIQDVNAKNLYGEQMKHQTLQKCIMLCYKEMTFCTFFKECADGQGCSRALTDEVREAAKRWMKDGPIAQWVKPPECFVKIKGNK